MERLLSGLVPSHCLFGIDLAECLTAPSPEKKKFALGVIHELMKRSLLND
jgi:hypothetical protein